MNKEQEQFRDACLSSLPLNEWMAGLGIDGQKAESLRSRWLVSDKCRGCNRPVDLADFDVWLTYWKSLWAPCHKACKVGMKQEAIDCQTVDADCNDCRYFERGKSVGLLVIVEGATSTHSVPANGHCKKHDRPAVANGNMCTGWPCFEHRRKSPA